MDKTAVVIIRPPYELSEFDLFSQEPVGLEYVVACLREAGYPTVFLDCEFEELGVEEVLLEIERLQPALVGLSVMSRRALIGALQVAQGVKQWAAPEALGAVGGHFPSFAAEQILAWTPEFDAVALFEGEYIAPALAAAALGKASLADTPGIVWRAPDGIRRNPSPPPVRDLDRLPWPARDVLPAGLRLGRACSISSSRGCSGRCAFCTIHVFYRQAGAAGWRARDPIRVVDEIEGLQRRFGVREVNFIDDDFIGRPGEGWARAQAFARELLRRRLDLWYEFECRPDCLEPETFALLRASGLQSIFIGIENITPEAQRFFHKRLARDTLRRNLEYLKELGLTVHVGYIMFNPWSTWAEIDESLTFLEEIGAANIHTLLNAMVVDYGSPVLPELIAAGLAAMDEGFSIHTRFADPAVAALFTVVQLALRPLFPYWYAALRREAALRTALHHRPGAPDLSAALADTLRDEAECDRIASQLFRDAQKLLPGTAGADLCGLGLRLRARGLEQIRSLSDETRALAAAPIAERGRDPL